MVYTYTVQRHFFEKHNFYRLLLLPKKPLNSHMVPEELSTASDLKEAIKARLMHSGIQIELTISATTT